MNQPTIIHDITSQGVKAVVPEYGRVILPLSELIGDQAGARLLLFATWPRIITATEIGSIVVFPSDPQISSQPDQSTLASLVLQLLNLPQPLVISRSSTRKL